MAYTDCLASLSDMFSNILGIIEEAIEVNIIQISKRLWYLNLNQSNKHQT